jgi:diguanylate cyclase (GGDEF)-like protein
MLALFALHALTGLGGRPSLFFDVGIYDGLELAASAALVVRALRAHGRERLAWALLGAAIGLQAAGDVVFSVVYAGDPPFPSPADAFYLAYYPLAYAGLFGLLRVRFRGVSHPVLLDGVMAALAAAGLAAAVLVEAVVHATSGSFLAVVTTIAYPLGDLLLLSLLATAWVLGRGRDGEWRVLTAALAIQVVADSIYLLQAANGTYLEGTALDVLWPLSTLLVAAAAWMPRRVVHDDEPRTLFAVPAIGSATGIAIVLYDHVVGTNLLALVLAIACLCAVLGRTWMSLRAHDELLRASRSEARTDSLTGLLNRRCLERDLAAHLAGRGGEWLLVLLDLDGFKRYNDTFGHPAGDALLRRLGGRLAACVASAGAAYRLGGDEFCVLVEASDQDAVVAAAREALSERAEHFTVTACAGRVTLPLEATTPTDALRLVDQRLYAAKHAVHARHRGAHGPLMQVLDEALQDPHHERVAQLARRLGAALGLSEEVLHELTLAGHLHDIGKLALPDALLEKAGPLDEEEWALIRTHPAVGQRILSAAPELVAVSALVRHHHERWDGGGYPDGLVGGHTPLGARVLAVADAYDAMTTARPHSPALTRGEALAELRRVAGRQLDPTLVERFCEMIAADGLDEPHGYDAPIALAG